MKKILLVLIFVFSSGIYKAQDVTLGPPVKLDDGFVFTEGPVWKDGALLFSDIDGNKIYRWHPDSGTTEYVSYIKGPNGLALDLEGKLVIAGHRDQNIKRMEDDGTMTVLADSFNNKKFNSPNDLTVKSDGAIFFTDPPWGYYPQPGELGYSGVFRLDTNGNVSLLDNSMKFPNGIVFSPDESLLYVDETNGNAKTVFVWDVVGDTAIANKRTFATVGGFGGNLDGMTVDSLGNVFVTAPQGIIVFNSEGTAIDTAAIPESVRNCCFGVNQNILYATAGNSIYSLEVQRSPVTGIKAENKQGLLKKSFKLYDLYPNPFNASAKIDFYVDSDVRVKVSVYDTAGKVVDIIADRKFSKGRHNLNWDANNFSSGVYYVQMAALKGIQTKKIMLLK